MGAYGLGVGVTYLGLPFGLAILLGLALKLAVVIAMLGLFAFAWFF